MQILAARALSFYHGDRKKEKRMKIVCFDQVVAGLSRWEPVGAGGSRWEPVGVGDSNGKNIR